MTWPANDPDDDAAVVAAGFASLTPIVGVREDDGPRADDLVATALAHLGTVLPTR